ncbi:unnamed protein product [Moneuplotes crassus]|uniref:Cyclic nucleotide-binding domain-containing protein n=1 Tax=Euplotes crassus TaxID=5936 RepID=A0AAD1XGB3_EUPCR|nr:unnamed protein product [Moneuplotes crassus]
MEYQRMIQVLKQQPKQRSERDIETLEDYFKENPNQFLDKVRKENGGKALKLTYKELKLVLHNCKPHQEDLGLKPDCHIIPPNKNIIEYGEHGITFYMILKGKVAVRVPLLLEKKIYNFQELCNTLFKYHPWFVKDDNYKHALSDIDHFYPEAVKKSKGQYFLNVKYLKSALERKLVKRKMLKEDLSPEFSPKSPINFTEEVKTSERLASKEDHYQRSFSFTILNKIRELTEGSSFGEIGIMSKKKRSATITTITDCTFAILEKSFSSIIGKIYRSEIHHKCERLNKFILFDKINEVLQEKAAIILKRHPIKFGMNLLSEGDPINYLYFILNGRFELNKKIYYKFKTATLHKQIDPENIRYSKYYCQKRTVRPLIENFMHIMAPCAQSFPKFKASVKGYMKNNSRILTLERYDIIGLPECLLESPYCIMDVKCISNDAEVYKMSKEDFLSFIPASEDIPTALQQKLLLINQRIKSLLYQLGSRFEEPFVEKKEKRRDPSMFKTTNVLSFKFEKPIKRDFTSKRNSFCLEDPTNIKMIAYKDLTINPDFSANKFELSDDKEIKAPTRIIETKELEKLLSKRYREKCLNKYVKNRGKNSKKLKIAHKNINFSLNNTQTNTFYRDNCKEVDSVVNTDIKAFMTHHKEDMRTSTLQGKESITSIPQHRTFHKNMKSKL